MGRLRKKPWALDYVRENSNIVFDAQKDDTLAGVDYSKKVEKLFKSEKPLSIEIGMGNGGFILNKSLKDKNMNWIGIEMYPSIQVNIMKKIKSECDTLYKNLRFISGDAQNIDTWFKENSIEKIYINFPDPWPKNRHEKRRLVNSDFLRKYYSILKEHGCIEFKTDQKDLFDFALEQFEEIKLFKVDKIDRDFQSKEDEKTKYEGKFNSSGNPVYHLEAHKW